MFPKPGKEWIQRYQSSKGEWAIEYRYCHLDGQMFKYTGRDIKNCQEAKNRWIKQIKE